MGKRFNLSEILLIVVSVALIVVTAFWKFQEPPQKAHDRGKLEGEIRVYKLWNEYLEELIDTLRAKGLLPPDPTDIHPNAQRGEIPDSIFDLYFSEPEAFVPKDDLIDTMPAIEIDTGGGG